MAALSIRNLDEQVHERLRVRAAENGHSMEAEVRSILEQAVAEPAEDNLFLVLHERFRALGGIDLELPDRAERPRAADLS